MNISPSSSNTPFRIQKVFDPAGKDHVRFAIDSEDQIKAWLKDTDLEFAIRYAHEVACPVFGKALVFPCTIIVA